MRVNVSFFIDEDIWDRLRDLSSASRITPCHFKINEILEEILPVALDEWERRHETISLIVNNRRLFI